MPVWENLALIPGLVGSHHDGGQYWCLLRLGLEHCLMLICVDAGIKQQLHRLTANDAVLAIWRQYVFKLTYPDPLLAICSPARCLRRMKLS